MTGLPAENNELSIKPLQLILIIAILQFIIAFFTDPMMLTFDESMWHYIGRNWIRNGLTPYTGGIDNKSPLIFYIFGISDRFFGVNYWFPRIVGMVVQSAGIYWLFKIAVKTIGARAGIFAISFYGLSLLWRSTGGKYVSYTETYAITAVIISVYFSIVSQRENSSFIGGLFAGLGFGFRFSAIFGILPVFIFTFKRSRKAAFKFLMGILVSTTLLVLLAEAAGIKMSDFLFYGLTDNFGPGSATDHILAWKVQRFGDGFFYSELILFYPAVISYFILNKRFDFLKAWLLSEFLGIVILGMYDRCHYKNLLPVMALMGASTIYFLVKNYHAPAKQVLLGMWILFFPKNFEPLFAVKKLFISRNNQLIDNGRAETFDTERLKRLVGLWIRAKTLSNEKVFVAGYGAQVQAYSERISPSVYFNATQTEFAKKRLYFDLTSGKPAMIVIPLFENYSNLVDGDIREFVNDLVTKNYSLDTCIFNYDIYKYKIIKP
jgi:4-amino-4-deoxy-L-arabinose transferase-like glycosyltransferase